ncbi:hypothetical protein ACWCPQ_02300 [Nocardia sp. NPDC001965]
MEIPELAELIWLFEAEPTREFDDLEWPVGLFSFRLARGDQAVSFSLDPTAGEAYISLYAGEHEHTRLGRIRRLDRLTVVRGPADYEGLRLWPPDYTDEAITLQTKPRISLSWNVKELGSW